MDNTAKQSTQMKRDVIDRLREMLGDRVSTAESVREQHGKGRVLASRAIARCGLFCAD